MGRGYRSKSYNFGTFEITKREIITSISIIAIMIVIGILISGKISEYQMDKNEIYNKAVKINDSEMFQYGMRTNVGNAFVYGNLEAVDSVTYPEIDGEYMYVKKVKEKYTKHTRTVTYKDSDGNTKKKEETYWTWDEVGKEELKCNEISFCEVIFPSNKINIPSATYVDTVKESSHVRHKYYGVKTEYVGTIFTNLKDDTISDNTNFYNNKDIESTIECLSSGGGEIVFWVCWIFVICICVYGFYTFENNWLE